jgi:hypothetical protein
MMKMIAPIFFNARLLCLLICTGTILLFSASNVTGQELPPRPISVYVNPAQGLNFGAFYHGNAGGTVIIYPNGSRSVTGDVIQANMGSVYAPALFEIEANPGTLISILNGPDVVLSGSNGGSLTLHIGSADPGSPLITTALPPDRTLVSIGGTLTVGNSLANPPGNYSGTFSITFIQE